MINPLFLLAQITPELNDPEVLRKSAKPSGSFGSPEITIVLICALALSAILFFWAFFIRKRPKTMRGALVVERVRKGSRGSGKSEDSSMRRKRKRRPDHPENWGRNPTVGETGGLPPERPDESSIDNDPNSPPAGSEGPQAVRPR